MDTNNRRQYLETAYRMFGLKDDENGVNRTQGLFMLCEDLIKPDFTIAEIGSFGGVSSEVLALHCQKLYCVDTWEDWSGDGFIYTAMERFDNMK